VVVEQFAGVAGASEGGNAGQTVEILLVGSDETGLHGLHEGFHQWHLGGLFLVELVAVDDGVFHHLALGVAFGTEGEIVGVVVGELRGKQTSEESALLHSLLEGHEEKHHAVGMFGIYAEPLGDDGTQPDAAHAQAIVGSGDAAQEVGSAVGAVPGAADGVEVFGHGVILGGKLGVDELLDVSVETEDACHLDVEGNGVEFTVVDDDVRGGLTVSDTTVFVHVCDDVVAELVGLRNEGLHLFDGPEVAAGAVAERVLIILLLPRMNRIELSTEKGVLLFECCFIFDMA